MTEAEWLQCVDPKPMLAFLCRLNCATDRKLRLFACACCRRLWHLLPDESNRVLVTTVEDHPDGAFSDPELNTAIIDSSKREYELRSDDGYWAVKYLGRSYYKCRPIDSAVGVASKVISRLHDEHDTEAEKAVQAALLRDLFGNPFHPMPAIDLAWLQWNEGAVPKLARVLYDERAFDRLVNLSDALEAAGCANPDLVTHWRHKEHARGCWFVDLLLGIDHRASQ